MICGSSSSSSSVVLRLLLMSRMTRSFSAGCVWRDRVLLSWSIATSTEAASVSWNAQSKSQIRSRSLCRSSTRPGTGTRWSLTKVPLRLGRPAPSPSSM